MIENTIMNQIRRIHDASKITELYTKMIKRNGKMVIHKGSFKPKIIFIGEAGGKEEDKCGIPFIGRSGKILNKWINEINNKYSIAVINAVPIMPENENGGIRKPKDSEIDYFRLYTEQLVDLLNPEFIILLGRSAEKCYFKNNIMKNTEWVLSEKNNRKVGLIYHPSYYIRRGQDGLDDFVKLIKEIP